MADLGEFLGTVLSGLAQARRVADEEAAALAEYYKQHPLLEGLAVSRIRIPEVTLELPMLIDEVQPGEDDEPETPAKVRGSVIGELERLKADGEISDLPEEFSRILGVEITEKLKVVRQPAARGRRIGLRETTSREVENAITKVARQPEFRGAIPNEDLRTIVESLRRTAALSAVKREGAAPALRSTVLTENVKANADPATVTRIRITLREEGLEWSEVQGADGKTRGRLTPE
jgi:hypothetical protein